jgi:hypothetical protein
MNTKLKIAVTSLVSLAAGLVAQASVQFSGAALLKVPNISSGDVSYLIIDENNTGFGNVGSINPSTSTFVAGSVYETTALTVGSDNLGSNFTIVGTKTATGTTTISVLGSYAGIQLTGGVDAGDKFAIIVFENSTTSAVASDTYRIFTDPTWVVPSDGFTITFSNTTAGSFAQLGTTATPAFTKTVVSAVPEPSTYAALAGVAVLGLAALRRRRA